jgi:hypothetical protein
MRDLGLTLSGVVLFAGVDRHDPRVFKRSCRLRAAERLSGPRLSATGAGPVSPTFGRLAIDQSSLHCARAWILRVQVFVSIELRMFKIEELSSLDRRGDISGVVDNQCRSDPGDASNELRIHAIVGFHLIPHILTLLNHSQMNNFLILPVAEACDLDLSSERYFLCLCHVIIELYIYALISTVLRRIPHLSGKENDIFANS